jgi:tetraacyldisaccharide 4'-kinase
LLDFLYGQIAAARRGWYERHPEARRRLRAPVISVGNLSVGGTGKTPLVAHIVEWLIARGERPAILSRGYKRRVASAGVTVVSDGKTVLADVDHAGDEPLMLAKRLPGAIVCVCEERHLAGALAERVLGATVHVLDDGFQHVQLARECDVLVSSPGEITRGRVLPRGRLRERRTAAARAQFVVFVDADRDAARAEAWELGIGAFSSAKRRPVLAEPAPRSAIAVAGIGWPEQFFAMLRDSGIELKETLAFPDHHWYSRGDVARIEAALERAGARVVLTTEKDAVRFAPLGTQTFTLVPVPMRLELDDWDALAAWLSDSIARRRSVA